MISRRSILGFLGMAPAAAVAAHLPVAEAPKADLPVEPWTNYGAVIDSNGRVIGHISIDAVDLSAITADLGTVQAGLMSAA
jgi:hypothetical protein